MREALSLAADAGRHGEIPVGCVIVHDGKIIGRGANRRETCHSALAHAEIVAIHEACRKTGDWRLNDASLFVTLEPCPMCAGAIMNARIGEIVFGARDRSFGACGGVINLFEENFGQHPQVVGGILEEDCARLLRRFFSNIR